MFNNNHEVCVVSNKIKYFSTNSHTYIKITIVGGLILAVWFMKFPSFWENNVWQNVFSTIDIKSLKYLTTV